MRRSRCAARLARRLESEDVGVLIGVRARSSGSCPCEGRQSRWRAARLARVRLTRDRSGRGCAHLGLGSAAFARAGLGQEDRAAALLTEIEATPGARETLYFPAYLPAMVRTALGIGERALAERLVERVEPRHPYAEHALVAANAALSEDVGPQVAANAYAEAADRWEGFGVVPEQAFALLGRGRCLLGLSRHAEACHDLRVAREIFDELDAAPMRSQAAALLAESTRRSS